MPPGKPGASTRGNYQPQTATSLLSESEEATSAVVAAAVIVVNAMVVMPF